MVLRPRLLIAKAAVAAAVGATYLLGGSSNAQAQTSPAPTVIYACVVPDGTRDGDANDGRLLRLVAANEACKRREVKISWNQIGPAGPAGANGATGPIGPLGPAGPVGPAGLNGTNGVDGAPGAMGPVGLAGANGTNGTNGVNGVDGAAGAAGVNGTNGADGAQGPAGPAGGAASLLGTVNITTQLLVRATGAWEMVGTTFSATTTGGPVMFTLSVPIWFPSGNGGNCEAAVDEDWPGRFTLPNLGAEGIGVASGYFTLNSTRVYVLPAGTYTFGIRCRVDGSYSNGATLGYTGRGTAVTQLSVIQLQ